MDKNTSDISLIPSAPVDFVIVTPLAEERDAILNRLNGCRQLPPFEEDIRVYYAGEVPAYFPDGSRSRYSAVVVPLARMGHTEAATATADAVRRWHPRYVLLVGIAGGIAQAGVRLGDVLIADQVADYELQKLSDGEASICWQVHRADQRLLIAAQNFTGEKWHATVARRYDQRRSAVHFGPVCTGSKVVADESLIRQFCEVWEKLVGVEMEAGGVANAAVQAARRPGLLMIRSVSDLADGDKDSRWVKRWRPYACEIAAAWTVEFLQSGPVPAAAQAVVASQMSGHIDTDCRVGARTEVTIEIDMEWEHWDTQTERLLKNLLGICLGISTDEIRVIRRRKGTVKISVELPADSAKKLLNAMRTAGTDLRKHLEPLILLDVFQEPAVKEGVGARSAVSQPDDGAIVPRNAETGSELVETPQDITFEGITRSLDNVKLGFLDKLALARDKTRALIALRKQELGAALQTSEMATKAKVSMASRAIALYRDNYESEIRNSYVSMLASVGLKVDSAQLDFVTECSRQLDAFKSQLQSTHMRPEFRERILDSVQKAFYRLYDKLDEITNEIISEAQQEKGP